MHARAARRLQGKWFQVRANSFSPGQLHYSNAVTLSGKVINCRFAHLTVPARGLARWG